MLRMGVNALRTSCFSSFYHAARLAGNFPYGIPVTQLSTGRHQVRVFRQQAGQQILIGGATVAVERKCMHNAAIHLVASSLGLLD